MGFNSGFKGLTRDLIVLLGLSTSMYVST